MSPCPHRGVVDFNEAIRRKLGLCDFQYPAPALFQLGLDALVLHVLVDQLVAVRQARHELARIQMDNIEGAKHAVACVQHAKALQEHHRVVAVFAIARACEMDCPHRAWHRREVRFGEASLQRFAIEQHRHRETQAQSLNAGCQVGQVNAVQLDPRSGDGMVYS